MNDQNKSESRFVKGRTDIKIVILGSSGTGKTSFCNLWINNTFTEEYKATVMSEFSFKMYNYKGNYYKVQIWDLAGQDKNIYTSKVFTKGSHGCLILYDSQDKKSFENTIKWKKSIDDNATFIDGTPLPIVLVQNKIDLVDDEALMKKNLKNSLMKMAFLLLLEQVAKIIKMLMRLWISFWQMLLIDLKNITKKKIFLLIIIKELVLLYKIQACLLNLC